MWTAASLLPLCPRQLAAENPNGKLGANTKAQKSHHAHAPSLLDTIT